MSRSLAVRMWARLRLRYFPPLSPYPLALFRIALSALMLIELACTAPAFYDLFGPRGFLQANLMDALAQGVHPPIDSLALALRWDSRALLTAVLIGQALALVALLLGIGTRLASIGVWAGETLLMSSGSLSVYGLDRYFHLFSFIGIFLPWGEALSCDAWRRRHAARATVGQAYGLRFLQAAIGVTYLNAGWAKMQGRDWWNGDAIWRAVNVPDFRQWDLLWLWHYPWLLKGLCWGTLLLETGYVFAMAFPRCRRVWAAAIIGLHLGIAVFMGLYLFALSLALINAIVFLWPEQVPRIGFCYNVSSGMPGSAPGTCN